MPQSVRGQPVNLPSDVTHDPYWTAAHLLHIFPSFLHIFCIFVCANFEYFSFDYIRFIFDSTSTALFTFLCHFRGKIPYFFAHSPKIGSIDDGQFWGQEQQLVGFICFQWHLPSIRVCPITRTTLLHLTQIQNTKYKIQSMES